MVSAPRLAACGELVALAARLSQPGAVQEWERTASAQAWIITRRQLADAGMTWSAVHHRIERGLWHAPTPTVIATTTGNLTPEQLRWVGVLHAGAGALVAGLTAAEQHGLRNWHRETIDIVVPVARGSVRPVAGIRFTKSSRDLGSLRAHRPGPPMLRIGPAVLLFAAGQASTRTAEGVLAATVQQRLSTAESLARDLDALGRIRHAAVLREALSEISHGAHSVGELDIRRLCRRFNLRAPMRQVRRRDSSGRVRFTDCEWRLSNGMTLVLEIDGGFHMELEQWEDDLARQRALTTPDRLIVRCTTRELRDTPEVVARDLKLLGVPSAA